MQLPLRINCKEIQDLPRNPITKNTISLRTAQCQPLLLKTLWSRRFSLRKRPRLLLNQKILNVQSVQAKQPKKKVAVDIVDLDAPDQQRQIPDFRLELEHKQIRKIHVLLSYQLKSRVNQRLNYKLKLKEEMLSNQLKFNQNLRVLPWHKLELKLRLKHKHRQKPKQE